MTFKQYKLQVLQDDRSEKLDFAPNNKNNYVYRITNTKLNKHYYGSKTTTLIPKDSIGIKYFYSSKDKEFIKDQLDNPQNYKYKVIFNFDNSGDKQIMESYLHDYFNVKEYDSFYNKANQTPFGFDTTSKTFCFDTKNNINVFITSEEYENNKDRYIHESKNKIISKNKYTGEIFKVTREEFLNNPDLIGINAGFKHSEETLINMSEVRKGEKHPMFGKKRPEISERMKGENNPMYGRTHSDVYKQYLKEMFSGRNNPKAKFLIIVDNLNIQRYFTIGNFIKFLKENNMPYKAFENSLHNNCKLYQKSKPKNKDWLKYKGWYVLDTTKLKFLCEVVGMDISFNEQLSNDLF